MSFMLGFHQGFTNLGNNDEDDELWVRWIRRAERGVTLSTPQYLPVSTLTFFKCVCQANRSLDVKVAYFRKVRVRDYSNWSHGNSVNSRYLKS